MTPNRSPRAPNVSLFIGLWLGLTAVAGIGIFALIYWAIGGFDSSAATAVAVIPTQSGLPTAAAAGTPAGPVCNFQPAPASGFGYGIQSHVFVGDNTYFMDVNRSKLSLQWVKMQLRWNDVEKSAGSYDWGILDSAISAACSKGLHIMLSVVAAPDWTHANLVPAAESKEAPPDDPAVYAGFLAQLIDRYPGQIAAIEVWNEMNLDREWNTPAGISAADYVRLLQVSYATIKSKDPSIVVISGAPSPTGINCNGSFPECPPTGRPVVVDDVTYLQQFIAAGGLAYADCVGTHSNGTNLPPAADGAHPPADRSGYTFTGPWDNPHYSWALKSQVETYAALLNGQKLQCVTEFGYASPIDGKYPPNFGFAADITEQEQGEYLVQAFNWMRDSKLVKLAFLFNLDYGQKGGDPATDDSTLYSLIYPNGAPRPAFDVIGAMTKP